LSLKKVKKAQNRTPGSVTLRSRWTSDGTSRRNGREAVGEAGVAAASLGIAV
jgi:hypothetical protein